MPDAILNDACPDQGRKNDADAQNDAQFRHLFEGEVANAVTNTMER
jgi:hypothetical protein